MVDQGGKIGKKIKAKAKAEAKENELGTKEND